MTNAQRDGKHCRTNRTPFFVSHNLWMLNVLEVSIRIRRLVAYANQCDRREVSMRSTQCVPSNMTHFDWSVKLAISTGEKFSYFVGICMDVWHVEKHYWVPRRMQTKENGVDVDALRVLNPKWIEVNSRRRLIKHLVLEIARRKSSYRCLYCPFVDLYSTIESYRLEPKIIALRFDK